jgi:transposase InsO family protein
MHHHHDPSSEALTRFTIISQVNARIDAGEDRAAAVRAVAACEFMSFDGVPRRVSERSLYRWLSAYEARGLAGLEPRARTGNKPSLVLPDAFVKFLSQEKRHDQPASIPEIIRRAKELGVLAPGATVQRSTVFRAAKRLGLKLARGKRAQDRDARRFRYPHRMDMVLCDGKHFRAGQARSKRVALFFIDDATRYVLHVAVGTTETTELFLRGLYGCISKHGLFSALYADHGPGFVARDTVAVLAQLTIPLIHGEAGYKEGRGGIERFNRTANADVLRNLDGRPDVDSSCGALELRLSHYVEHSYAQRPHEALKGDTPWQRFHNDPKPLRFPDDSASLRAKFEIWVERRVANDHVVSVEGVVYEMPKGYGGQKVVLRRRLLDDKIGFLHDGRLIDLHPVDLAGNARAKRVNDRADQDDTQPVPRPSAADMAFARDFGPIVGDDGGFVPPPDESQEGNHGTDQKDKELPW